MANQLEAAIPRILAQGLKALRENAVMPRLVNTDYGSDARKRGSSVDVYIPSSLGDADDVTPGPLPVQPADLTPKFVPVVLNRWKKKDFYMTDRDLGEVADGYYNVQVTEAARSIANAVDKDLLALYKSVYGFAGVAGQTPFQEKEGASAVYKGLGAARDARKVLNRQLAPMENRRIVLDVDAEAGATALPEFVSALNAGTDQTIREGSIGRKLGFDWDLNQNILSHTTGVAGTLTTSGAGNIAGSETLTVAGATSPPVPGDTFSIAGDEQGYVVKSGTLTSWQISPPLKVAAADGAAITPVADHVVNLAFHRDAFALAVRPLQDIDPLGNRIETFTDDKSGLTMRLEISRANKETIFSFDILYGCAVIRPEFACRILG